MLRPFRLSGLLPVTGLAVLGLFLAGCHCDAHRPEQKRQAGPAPVEPVPAAEQRKSMQPPAPATTLEKHPHPTMDAPWANSLGMEFVPVKEAGVLFGIWDVRVKDYRAHASAKRGVDRSWENPGYVHGDAHPVVKVNWNEAKAFCAWLTEKERREGLIGGNQTYRLPRDWEWSVAAGLNESHEGTPREKDEKTPCVYPWGTAWPPPGGAGNYDSSLNVDNHTNMSPVGSFKANRFGLYDMGGNVWQWCEDEYAPGSGGRVLRGASWNDGGSRNLLSSFRDYSAPVNRRDDLGFRCVLAGGDPRQP
jgi:hypothetical protein